MVVNQDQEVVRMKEDQEVMKRAEVEVQIVNQDQDLNHRTIESNRVVHVVDQNRTIENNRVVLIVDHCQDQKIMI